MQINWNFFSIFQHQNKLANFLNEPLENSESLISSTEEKGVCACGDEYRINFCLHCSAIGSNIVAAFKLKKKCWITSLGQAAPEEREAVKVLAPRSKGFHEGSGPEKLFFFPQMQPDQPRFSNIFIREHCFATS